MFNSNEEQNNCIGITRTEIRLVIQELHADLCMVKIYKPEESHIEVNKAKLQHQDQAETSDAFT